MKPTKDDIRRRLGLREVPKPPDDLVRRLKADIPPSFRYTGRANAGRKDDLATSVWRGMSWQVAASFLLLTLAGVGIYMVTFETEQLETAKLAEADRAPAVEFAPPTAPAAAAREQEADAAKPKAVDAEPAAGMAYDIAAAPPPPPPPPPAARADSAVAQGVEGGVEGGVAGGVLGGVIASAPAPAESNAFSPEKEVEAQRAKGRDERYAEEKLAAGEAPAPAAAAAPSAAAAKDDAAYAARGTSATTMVSAAESMETLRAKAASGEPLRVGGAVKAPVVIERVEIAYPAAAREARVQGVVVIEAIVDRSGKVKSAKVLKPLPHGLDDAALAAVKQWKFKPATLEGKPVEVVFNLTVNAKLSR